MRCYNPARLVLKNSSKYWNGQVLHYNPEHGWNRSIEWIKLSLCVHIMQLKYLGTAWLVTGSLNMYLIIQVSVTRFDIDPIELPITYPR